MHKSDLEEREGVEEYRIMMMVITTKGKMKWNSAFEIEGWDKRISRCQVFGPKVEDHIEVAPDVVINPIAHSTFCPDQRDVNFDHLSLSNVNGLMLLLTASVL